LLTEQGVSDAIRGGNIGSPLAFWQEMLRLPWCRGLLTIPLLVASLVCPTPEAHAQDSTPQGEPHDHQAATTRAWQWTPDASAFFGLNYQNRKFTDFASWESQNWAMLAGERQLGAGRLSVKGMLSLEAFTLKALGSPQVFQTGEAYHGGPLIDYQHPHDLLMQLGAAYRVDRRHVSAELEVDLVGAPALGPTPFMHRASARDNPQVPLTHHYLDATHITTGVIRGGIGSHGITVESSIFRGEEPNENRLNIDRPRLNSWSVRAGWRGGPWRVQVSGGKLHEPESFDPYDITRLTASIEFDGSIRSKSFAATLAWGQNREIHGTLDGYLLEWNWQARMHDSIYGRGEIAAKDILGLGSLHPLGFRHFHPLSRVAAGTLGYVRELPVSRWGRTGVGADVTVYRVSDNLLPSYGAPRSFHVFLRWRPSASPSHRH
jgi:hypothetical protein